MKRIVAFAALVAIAFAAGYFMQPHIQPEDHDTSSLAPVVVLGDTQAASWRESPEWSKLGPRAVCRAANADTTDNVLWQLQNGALGGTEPNAVIVIAVGGTDLHRGASGEKVAAGVVAIVAEVRRLQPQSRIIVYTPWPMRGADDPTRAATRDLAARLPAALTDPNVNVVDIRDRFLDAAGNSRPDLKPDGVRLTPAAYAIWCDDLLPRIKEEPPAPPVKP